MADLLTPPRVTMAEFARMRGCTRQTVDGFKRKGWLALDSDGLVLVDASNALIEQRRDPARGGHREKNARENAAAPGPRALSAPTYQVAAAEEKTLRSRMLKLELAERAGQLVSKDAVEREAFRLARTTLDRLVQIPDRLAPQLAAMTEVHAIADLLEAEIRTALAEVAAIAASLHVKPSEESEHAGEPPAAAATA